MVRLLLSLALISSFAFGGFDPVGQKAHYVLDKDPKRTTSMIKSGTIDVMVTKPLLDAAPPAYEVSVKYKAKISLVGDQEGEQAKAIDAEFFTPEFLEKLRKEGSYIGPNFKAKHQGYADAKNLDGKLYPHCDKILLYDIKDSGYADEFTRVFFDLDRFDIENLQIVAHIYAGVPVLGAVKIDASGIYQGMNVKAGGDFQLTP